MLYAVRMKVTGEAVGIVFADRFSDLPIIVDEATDPGLCEAKLVRGGVIWTGKTDLRFPIDGDYLGLADAAMSGELADSLMVDAGWRDVPPYPYPKPAEAMK